MDICQEKILHQENVQKAVSHIPDTDTLFSLTDIFKALSDPNRLKIVIALARCELCVCDLAAIADLSVSAVSHQLRLLRDRNLVKARRDGRMVYYSLVDQHVTDLMDSGITTPATRSDLLSLSSCSHREDRCCRHLSRAILVRSHATPLPTVKKFEFSGSRSAD